MNRWLNFKEITRLYEEKTKFKCYCKCGHSLIIANKSGMKLCSHCKNLVFRDKETEFKFRLKQNLIKERRNLK